MQHSSLWWLHYSIAGDPKIKALLRVFFKYTLILLMPHSLRHTSPYQLVVKPVCFTHACQTSHDRFQIYTYYLWQPHTADTLSIRKPCLQSHTANPADSENQAGVRRSKKKWQVNNHPELSNCVFVFLVYSFFPSFVFLKPFSLLLSLISYSFISGKCLQQPTLSHKCSGTLKETMCSS